VISKTARCVGEPRTKWGDSIKMHIGEIGFKAVYWIDWPSIEIID
jgi:hypothetical protein